MATTDANRYDEIWVRAEDGQLMGALINGGVGWLTYLRGDGDAGFSSRNPEYNGRPDAKIEYYLNNVQIDEYPAAWALPIQEVEQAIEYFRLERKPPPFVTWHDDSGDGKTVSGEWDKGWRKRRQQRLGP